MRPRIADTLKTMGYEGSVEEFRAALAEIKAEHYPQFTIDNRPTPAMRPERTACTSGSG